MYPTIEEIKRLEAKIIYYETQVKNGTFNLNIDYETNIAKIDFRNVLTTEIHHYNPNDFSIEYLCPIKVAQAITNDFKKIYSQSELFAMSEKIKTARLIEFIQSSNKIIPPIIEPIHNNLAIRDGNHRLGLMCYLNIASAPFLIKTNLTNKLNHLV